MKKLLRKIWPYLSITLFLTTVALIEVYALMNWVEAASYNVFFNNVEQGANSRSNPSLTIGSDKKPVVDHALQDSTTPTTLLPPEETAVAPSTSTEVSLPQEKKVTSSKTRFKAGLLAHMFANRKKDLNWNNAIGGTLSLNAYMLDNLAIGAFGGLSSRNVSYFGGELLLTPVRVSLFGLENFLELSGVLGWTEPRNVSGISQGFLHGGAKLGLNLGEHYEATAGLTTNLSHRSQGTALLAQAGISFKF